MAVYTLYAGTAVSSTMAGPNEVLVKEDVSDLISNLFPYDTPLHQLLEREPMSQIFKEAPVDDEAGIVRTSTSVGMNAAGVGADSVVKLEASTASAGAAAYPSKIRAVNEIHQEAFEVSGTDRAVDHYAITDPFTYRAMKLARKMTNDAEARYWHGKGTRPDGAVVTNYATGAVNTTDGLGGTGSFPRQTQGVFNWIMRTGLERTTVGVGANFFNAHGEQIKGTGYNYCSYAFDASGLNFDSSLLQQKFLGEWWGIGGDPRGCVLLMGRKPKQLFSTVALTPNGEINSRAIPADNKRIVDTIDVYETQFGIHYVNLVRYLDLAQTSVYDTTSAGANVSVAWDESIIAIQPRYWRIGVLRGLGFTPLAKTGDFDRGMFTSETGIICKSPIGGGCGIANCVAA